MFAFFIKFALFHLITSSRLEEQSDLEDQREIKPLDESIKEYLQADSYTTAILASIYELGLSEELKSIRHLTLNNFADNVWDKFFMQV